MKRYIIVIVIFILILSFSTVNDSVQEVEWNDFIWADNTIGGKHYDKAAILIPFKINGIEEIYHLQLDTGASSVLYGNSLYNIVPGYGAKTTRASISGTMSNYEFTYNNFRILQDYGVTSEELKSSEYKLIGSLGLDFFKNKILVINFPEQKFAIFNSRKSIPQNIKGEDNLLDMKYRNNKIYLKSKIGNEKLSLIYDTGSSIFDIVTTKEIWTNLTNSKNDEDIRSLEIYSWGDMITIKGVRSDYDWEIGDIIVENPFIFYEPSGLKNFNFKSIKSDGLLGNAIFYDNHIITINLINKEFRIMEVRP